VFLMFMLPLNDTKDVKNADTSSIGLYVRQS